MRRITIKRDKCGNVSVTGNPDLHDSFFTFAFDKVLDGKYEEVSWKPLNQPLMPPKEDDHAE